MPTTARYDAITRLKAILDSFATTNPTLLRRTFRTRPPSLNTDMPCAYPTLPDEDVSHDSGTRLRSMTIGVEYVDELTANDETSERFDTTVDALLDHFTANPHITTNTVWSRLRITNDYEETGDGRVFARATFTFLDHDIREGRQ